MTRLEFRVAGLPVPQGSMKAFVRGKHASIVHDNGANLGAWRNAIAEAAKGALSREGQLAFEGAVKVSALFVLPRPRAHFGVRGILARFLAILPVRKPDLDKLCRSALDAMTGVLFLDDAQVVELHARKTYTDSPSAAPGALIVVSEVVL